MFRRHHLAVLALGLAGTPLAAQQAGSPLAPHPAEWTASATLVAPVDAAAALDAPFAAEAARVHLDQARTARQVRPSFPILSGILGMLAGGAAGGSVMSRKCEENCGVKAFYGALGGSTLGFTLGFVLGRAAEGGDPTIPVNVPRPVN